MNVVVKKSVLEELIDKLTLENRSYHSADISKIPAKDDETPIEPQAQVPLQLSTAQPPVDDPDYVPTSVSDLAVAASTISQEVPPSQVEFFYRLLHKILDLALDRHDAQTRGDEDLLREMLGLIFEDQESEKSLFSEAGEARGVSRSHYVNLAMDAVINKIVQNRLHMFDVPGTATRDFHTGQERPEQTLASAEAVDAVFDRAMEFDPIKREFDKGVRDLNILPPVFEEWIKLRLSGYLAKEGRVSDSPEDAMAMFSNRLADTLWKEAEKPPSEADAEELGDKTTEDKFKIYMDRKISEIGAVGDYTFSVSGIEGEFSVSSADLSQQIMTAQEDKIGRELGLQAELGAAESEKIPETESLTSDEVKAIRKKIRDEALADEFEPGRLNLSQEAVRAMTEKISEEMNTGISNVRNVLYDDLLALGLPSDVLRKVFGLRRMPRGRESIPVIYDDLRVKASTGIIEKSYELFRYAFEKFLKNRYDDETIRERFFGPNGVYQPDLAGYERIQNVVGGPDIFVTDVDINSQKFRDMRNAFEAVQVFINELAKEFVPEDTHRAAKEGGIRAFLLDFQNAGAFGTIEAREDFDEFLAKKIKLMDSFKRDEDLLVKMIDTSLAKAPARRDRYIRQIEKEKASE
jgi:hypothetical protein